MIPGKKSIGSAIDRQYIIDHAAKNYAIPAYAWVPRECLMLRKALISEKSAAAILVKTLSKMLQKPRN